MSTESESASKTEKLDRLLAYEEIRQLAYRYARATDARDIDTLVGLFVDDVRVGRDLIGREALGANFTQQLRAIGRSILHVSNHIIDFTSPDHATGLVYCRGEIESVIDGGGSSSRSSTAMCMNGARRAGVSFAVSTCCSMAPMFSSDPTICLPRTGQRMRGVAVSFPIATKRGSGSGLRAEPWSGPVC